MNLQIDKKRGGGRPISLSPAAQEKAKITEMLCKQGKLSIQAICDHLDIAKMTLYHYLRF